MANKDPFVALGNKKKRDVVIDQIKDAIADHVFTPGDKLPSETELGKRLGVSRTTIREALSALELLGIVDIVHGEGTYVRPSEGSPKEEPEALASLVESGSFLEAIRVRKALDELIVQLAIIRATDADIHDLEVVLEKMKSAIDSRDYEGYLDANMSFHMTLVQISNDPILLRLTRYLVRVMELVQDERLDYYVQDESRAQETLAIHIKFFDSFAKRDEATACADMREHYDVVIRRMQLPDDA